MTGHAFAGIDYDTHAVHLVRIPIDEPHLPDYQQYRLTGGDSFTRTRDVRDALPTRTAWPDLGVIQIAIERPTGQRRDALCRIEGAILACLPSQLPVLELAPHEWRHACGLTATGRRDQLKLDSRIYFANRLGVRLSDAAPWAQDAVDAYCIAAAALELCEKGAAAA